MSRSWLWPLATLSVGLLCMLALFGSVVPEGGTESVLSNVTAAEAGYDKVAVSPSVKVSIGRTDQWLAKLFPIMDAKRKTVFDKIFAKDMWNGNRKFDEETTRAGPGSTMTYTARVRDFLGKFIAEHHIETMADLSCNEMLWQRAIPGFEDLKLYAGFDIVPHAIEVSRNRTKGMKNVELAVRDMVNQPLSRPYDLVMVRDTLFHLPLTDALQVIANINNSGSKYFGTTYVDDPKIKNVFIAPGDWYAINLRMLPFLFPAPLAAVEEGQPGNAFYGKKKFAIWKLPIEPHSGDLLKDGNVQQD